MPPPILPIQQMPTGHHTARKASGLRDFSGLERGWRRGLCSPHVPIQATSCRAKPNYASPSLRGRNRRTCGTATLFKPRPGRVADGTIERELVVLRAALRWAAKADAARWMNGKAAPEFTMPVSGATARVRWLTKAEAAKLLATCHLPHVRLLTPAKKEVLF